MLFYLLAQSPTTQGDYPTSIKSALLWVGGIAAVIVLVRVVLWPAIRDLIKDIAGFRNDLKAIDRAVVTNSQATAQLIDANKTLPQTRDVDPQLESSVKTVASRGTGTGGGGPSPEFR